LSARSVFRSTTSWAFGFSVTILFIALWGRAVAVDTDQLAESLAPLSDSGAVVDAFAGWMAEELVDSGYERDLVDPTIVYVLQTSATAGTLDAFVGDVVTAAASPGPEGSTVDVASLLAPAVPEVTAGLTELGLPAEQAEVASVVAGLDPMVVLEPGEAALIGPASPAATRLGTAALLAFLGMIAFGYLAVVSSEDRVAAVRGLFGRVAVGGVGFAILLLIGSWITDPRGGRAPVSETISGLTSSKWVLPLQIGLAAAVVPAVIYVGRRWLRREEASRSGDESPTLPQEQQLSRSGSR
jgi:hypothetical protein